jgi:lipopolysaccharide transport system permease protein
MYLVRYSDAYDDMSRVRRLAHWWDTIIVLVGRDMKLRYKRSALGVLWTMLNPLAQLLVLGFIFKNVMGSQVSNFRSFLFTGLLVWNWFASSLMGATSSITDNRDMVRYPDFRAGLLPIVYVSTNLVQFLLALPILMIVLFFDRVPLTPVLFALPFVIILQFIFTLGLGYVFATCHIAFRDTQYLLGVGLTMAFFVTPVFYDINTVPAKYLHLFRLNPMAHIVEAYRELLLQGKMPDAVLLLSLYFVSLIILGLGYLMFRNASPRFVEDL